MTTEQLKELALRVAGEMKNDGLAKDVRARFIEVRAELFQRGIYDPVLGRFDSATVEQASAEEVAEQLAKVAAAL